MASSSVSQPVSFVTHTKYPLPSQKFLIPTTWKRYQLSQLVNKALSLPTPVPFDFLVRGEILRRTLGEWCTDNGVGEEETLEIEYIESMMPPQKMADFPHEDWVSSVSCRLPGSFVAASYDGHVRTFDFSQNLLASVAAHAAPIASVHVVPTPVSDPSSYLLATASHDLTACLTKVTALDTATRASTSTALATLHLHTQPLSSIVSNTAGSHLLTGSWDALIGVWDTAVPAVDEVPEVLANERDRKKRRRVDDGSRAIRKAPLLVLKSHTARVSQALFAPDGNTVVSAGFDSTVRTWDTENGVCTRTIAMSEKPFLGLAVTADGHNALATATDRTMTMFDLRSTGLSASVASFLHPAAPSCVAASADQHKVVTGAYDGVVRLWDLRHVKSAVASFKAWGGSKKVLSVDWEQDVVAIGGEGGLEVWKVAGASRG